MFLMTFAHVALEMVCFVVSTMTEAVRALVWVLAFVTQFMGQKFYLIPELFRTNVTWEGAFRYSIKPIFAVLRNIGGDGDVIPIRVDPFFKFWQSYIFIVVIVDIGAVFEAVDVIETAWYLDLHLSRAFWVGAARYSCVESRCVTRARLDSYSTLFWVRTAVMIVVGATFLCDLCYKTGFRGELLDQRLSLDRHQNLVLNNGLRRYHLRQKLDHLQIWRGHRLDIRCTGGEESRLLACQGIGDELWSRYTVRSLCPLFDSSS